MLPSEITFIERGWVNGNNILIQGTGRPVIIDSGHLTSREETLALIRAQGVDPHDFEAIVSTHAHADHHGANRLLKSLSGGPIGLSVTTARWFAENETGLSWFNQMSEEVDVIEADFTFEHGDRITLSGLPFDVIGLPGHAPDCVGFYQPDTKVLVAADALWANDLGVLNVITHGWEIIDEAALALSRIQALDIDVVIPGHGGLIKDVDLAIARVTQRLERFRQSPKHLASHLTRRFLMYCLLRMQPIERDVLVETIKTDGWVYRYLPLFDPEIVPSDKAVVSLINRLLDEFVARGLVTEIDDQLSSHLPR